MSDYTESVAYSTREPAWSGLIDAKSAKTKTDYYRYESFKSALMPVVIDEVGKAILRKNACCVVSIKITKEQA